MADIILTNLRGGRNGIDSPLELPENQCVEARNVDWFKGALARKRNGGSEMDVEGAGFTDAIAAVYRHVPLGEEDEQQLWAVDFDGHVARLIAGAWDAITLDDAITSEFQNVEFCTFNGKLFIAYNSSVDRLHVYDPTLDLVRRVGLAAPGVPTAADHGGAGTYPAVLRYYRIRVIQWDGASLVTRRSEPSPAVAFTPDGAHLDALVTLGTIPNEHETHWELEVSLDGLVFFVLYGIGEGNTIGPPIAIATTTQVDNTSTAAYLNLDTSEEIGSFILPKSNRYLSTDQNRLIMAGQYESGPTSTYYYTPVLGSSDHGDDERLIIQDDLKTYQSIGEKDGGKITGISYPIFGIIYMFKYRQTHKLTPTGEPDRPYIPRKMSDAVGCIHSKTIVMAEDNMGNPIVGFLSAAGAYRVGDGGLLGCGRDVEDIWFGKDVNGITLLEPINLDASIIVAFGVYYAALHQIWWWIAQVGYENPNLIIVQDVKGAIDRDAFGIRGGWSVFDGVAASAFCATMFSTDTSNPLTSRVLRPFIGNAQLLVEPSRLYWNVGD